MQRLALLGLVSAVLALPVQDVPTIFKAAKEDPKALCYTTGSVAGDPCTFCKCFSPGNCIPVTAECDWTKNEAEHMANGCEPVHRPGICCPTIKCPEGTATSPEAPAETVAESPEAPAEPVAESPEAPAEPVAESPEAPAEPVAESPVAPAVAGYGQVQEVSVATEPEAPAEPAVVEVDIPAVLEIVEKPVPVVPVVVQENVAFVPVVLEEVVKGVPVAIEAEIPVIVETVVVEPEVLVEPVFIEPAVIEEEVPVQTEPAATEPQAPAESVAAYEAEVPVSEPVVIQPEILGPIVIQPEVPVVPEATEPEAAAEPEVPAEPELKEPETPAEPKTKKLEAPVEPETPYETAPESSKGYGVPEAAPSPAEQYFKASLEGKDADAKPGIVLEGISALQLAEEIAEPEEDQLLEATMTLKQLQLAKGPVLESTAPESLATEISNHFPDDEMIREVIAEINGPGAEVIGEVISEMNAAPAEEAIQKEMKRVDPHPLKTQEVVLEMTPAQIQTVIAALSPEEGNVSQTDALTEMLSEMAALNAEPVAAETPAAVTYVTEEQVPTNGGEVHTEIITKKEPIVIASNEPLIVVTDQPVVVVKEEPVLDNNIYNSVYSEGEKKTYNTPDELLSAASSIDQTIFLDPIAELGPEAEASGQVKGIDAGSLFAEEPAPEEQVEGSGNQI